VNTLRENANILKKPGLEFEEPYHENFENMEEEL
jgi:hypothetical protein